MLHHRSHGAGRRIFVESSYAPIRDAQGKIAGIVGVHRDISPVKEMLDRIKSSEELFRLALNGIPDIFLIYDRCLRLQFVNQRGAVFFAKNSADIIGRHDEDLLPAEVTRTYHPTLLLARTSKSTQSVELSYAIRGRQFTIAATYVPMLDDAGEIRQILGLLHDFTKRRQERLAFMAQYDVLTGLPARRWVEFHRQTLFHWRQTPASLCPSANGYCVRPASSARHGSAQDSARSRFPSTSPRRNSAAATCCNW